MKNPKKLFNIRAYNQSGHKRNYHINEAGTTIGGQC